MSAELDGRVHQEQPRNTELQEAGARDVVPPRPKRGIIRRFRADRRGATAIEFGLLSMPFFFMLMMIVEMSMIFWSRQVLQEATSQAARTVLTGESRTLYTGSAAVQTAAFRNAICARMALSSDCSTRVFVDVQPLGANFPASQAATMITGGVIDPSTFVMRPVAPETVAIVRVAYKIPVISAGYFGSLAKLNTGENVLQAVVAFRTEPFLP
jgi:pilus assembly protein Flp/PilA